MTINTQRPTRHFLPEDFNITTWENLKPYFEQLTDRDIDTKSTLEQWLKNLSELSAVLYEDVAWRYIAMTCDTESKEKADKYMEFVKEIQPHVAMVDNQLNQKLLASPALNSLEGSAYEIMLKRTASGVEIFREENVPIQSQIQEEQQQYTAMTGKMSVEIDGKELTMQQAGVLLKDLDRNKRESVYRKIQERRSEDAEAMDKLFSSLVKKRHQMAVNAGFANYRDYAFKARNRFDYTADDCKQFHESIVKSLLPLANFMAQERKDALGVSALRPWDSAVDMAGKPPLKAFETVDELVDNSIECFKRLHPLLGNCLATMKDMSRLDLDSRKGKSPGGYNYPLMESGIPFVFMNATSTVRDMVTLMHEGGHAVHSILTKDLALLDFKHMTPEIAELASMSMELISMDHWELFFKNEEDLRRAKINHLSDVLSTMPWIALIDSFQHWIYENPEHTIEERTAQWEHLYSRFSENVTDWTGLEQYKSIMWHKQLHLFELPFYYIEYGFAQLGAIAVWRNYRENPDKALSDYIEALKLGYTKPIGEVYKRAGAAFDFSQDYIQGLMDFVKEELDALT